MKKAEYKKLVKAYHDAKVAEARAKALAEELKQAMAEDNITKVDTGEYIVTITTVNSTRFDSTTFKADHADLYQQYSKPTSSTRLNIK